MAINEEPLNFGSDSTQDESDARINDDKPKQPEFNSTETFSVDISEKKENVSPEQNLQENTLVPLTPPKPTTITPVVQQSEIATTKFKKIPLWKRWQLWGILLVLCSGGVGYGATTMLLKLPKTQSCSKVFWPIASASIRLYCAQTAAEEKDVAGLLAAIELVAVLPENHPLRPEIDRNIDRWAAGILTIGEDEFQEGNLEEAIATAQKIPRNLSSKELVDQKIEQWNSIWSEGEEQYAKVEEKLREADWNGAFNWAVRLTDSSNQYWATTKYEESINNINVAQEENASLTKAQTELTNGTIENLIIAIDRADDIKEGSYTYEQAQEIIQEGKEKLVANMERLIERRDWQQLLRITPRIPRSLNLQKRVEDWQILANAGSSAQLDTVFGIEEAIEEAEKLEKDSEYYDLGQKLIKSWTSEIDGVRHLSKAREISRVGTIANLNQAIAEAKLVSSSNPRYSEALQEINKWRGQIQTIEDRPILNRAQELSYGNNINAWRRAIAEVNLISRSSPLYSEAQNYARTWRANVERVEDEPILDEADSFANINNYPAAIDAARKVRSGRALYPEAQSRISRWQQEVDGQKYISEANNIARGSTPEALAQAIRTARQASPNSSVYPQVVRDVNDWAAEILSIARQASDNSLEQAIEIAAQVPSGTTSFSTAQEEIKAWKIRIAPPLPEAVPPTFKLDKLRKQRDRQN
ncbi:chromosome segregation ATPase [Waterburya agarophytonicola K14]|uniref:Chromosome segregation ATPase n=1 Tax=Waterburya agarophytonicola KI4 TaxID=2874699 RepID=A0A964FG14_9CYAN|nr:chromosome segregation ATPase [Waterburya agarophytonicola]MCC0177536.1 chromosome segregation ATPase [Waterburya agarophytonicola KI4]